MRLFLLSPANTSGPRGRLLLTSNGFDLARRLDSPEGVPIGEVFSFISGLYFRGKLTYVRAFAPESAYVITPSRGLLHPDTPVTREVLHEFASVPIDATEPRYREPLVRDLLTLACDPACEVVLLGSVASPKYVEPLLTHLGPRLLFPSTFVGRGDMSRGGVMLRAASARVELEYQPVAGAVLRGKRPARLEPLRR
ncbi:MAG TPA: hypothetical protein VIL35_02220 [Vicinamibacterales bacterium]